MCAKDHCAFQAIRKAVLCLYKDFDVILYMKFLLEGTGNVLSKIYKVYKTSNCIEVYPIGLD